MKITKNPVLGTWELAESEEEIRPSAGSAKTPCTDNLILIVDDESRVRKAFFNTLSSYIDYCEIAEAGNGKKALEFYKKRHPKVILLDLAMPVMSGEVTFHQIIDFSEEQEWEPPCVIFCTGFDPSNNIRNIAAGDPAHCLLHKPVRNQTLVSAVEKRLKRN